MTHFTVGIIVPPAQNDIEGYVALQMDPYVEHDEAEPYVYYSLDQAAADIAASIRRLELVIARNEPMYDIDKCRSILARLRATTPQQYYDERIRFHEQFDDEGRPISTYNPDSKWDWYAIGGRWDGWINDREASNESIEDNSALVEEAVARNSIPHAVITPDGDWHERGEMGWFATLLTENENWEQDARAILAPYAGYRFVIVDAHI
jgi:hypothetical protein